jgi:hypothetical protein
MNVADWTRRSAEELSLSSTRPGPEAGERPGGRRPVVAGGGRVVGTASLVLWDVLEAAEEE